MARLTPSITERSDALRSFYESEVLKSGLGSSWSKSAFLAESSLSRSFSCTILRLHALLQYSVDIRVVTNSLPQHLHCLTILIFDFLLNCQFLFLIFSRFLIYSHVRVLDDFASENTRFQNSQFRFLYEIPSQILVGH